MAEVTLTINGRNYGISCDDGQEQRVVDLGHYVDSRMKDISRSGAASNDTHLLVLTALMLADESFDARQNADQNGQAAAPQEDELVIARVIDQLADRIDTIADRMAQAS